MKKSIICALLVCTAFNAVAQTNNPNRPNRDDRRDDRRNDPRDLNECPRPGLIDSKFMGEVGEEMSMGHQRIGTPDISSNFTVSGLIRSKIFANHVDRICAEKTYVETQRVCEDIPVEIALGRGNALLGSLFDMQITILKRADAFSRAVRFSEGRTSAERFDISTQIINQLTRAASVRGIPKSMMEFTAMLKQAMNEGYLTFSVVEDITVVYRTANEQSLGFLPLEGTTVLQGTGNGRLNTLFDLGLSPFARAARIQSLILGVSAAESMSLSSSFINFAATNGIPSSWDQFVMMMRSAVSSRVITERTLQMVTADYELNNRQAMGFELSAELCRMMEVNRTKNVIETLNRRDFVRNSSKGYEINLVQAPLLLNEKEGMILTTDGLRNLDLKISSSYNRYQVQGIEVGGIMRFNVVGSRLAVKPENNLKVKFSKMGDNSLHVRIQNRGFNPKIGGKVIVRVKFINGKMFDDKVLGTETYELDGSTELVKIAAFKHKDVDFVKVSLQIVGSPYFGEEFSESVKAKH